MHRALAAAVAVLSVPFLAFAHQPRIVDSIETIVTEPEISKAYYGELTGEPHLFLIEAPKEFALYANILVPDVVGVSKDVSVVITRGDTEIARIGGADRVWEHYYEEFAGDWYWRGPAYASQAPPGSYVLRVSSPDNRGKYALAVGEIEAFDGAEILNVLSLKPRLKRDLFETQPAAFLLSIGGAGIVIVLFVLSFAFTLLLRLVLRRFNLHRGCAAHHNIGVRGRALRLILAAALLAVAVATSWNPLVIALSGFVFAETVLGWCVFCAIFGKKICPTR